MSKIALEEFDGARILQTTQNDARRIFQRIKAAQENPTRASIRWRFELIQNAHDAGPSEGNNRVEQRTGWLYLTRESPLSDKNCPHLVGGEMIREKFSMAEVSRTECPRSSGLSQTAMEPACRKMALYLN